MELGERHPGCMPWAAGRAYIREIGEQQAVRSANVQGARLAAGRWTSRRCGRSWATRSWTAARSATPSPATCAGLRPRPTPPSRPWTPFQGPHWALVLWQRSGTGVRFARLPRPPARGKAGPEGSWARRAQRRRGAVRGRDRALQRGVRLRRPGQVPAHGPQEGQGPAGARPRGAARAAAAAGAGGLLRRAIRDAHYAAVGASNARTERMARRTTACCTDIPHKTPVGLTGTGRQLIHPLPTLTQAP